MSPKKQKMSNQLEALKAVTSVVADTGDFNTMKEFTPDGRDHQPVPHFQGRGSRRVLESRRRGRRIRNGERSVVGGEVGVGHGQARRELRDGDFEDCFRASCRPKSTRELSFDTGRLGRGERAARSSQCTRPKAVDRSRILIKLATTWECLEAAKILKKDNITCNMTLLFSFAQAVGAAEAGVKLISPFVGRILDWNKKATGRAEYAPEEDPRRALRDGDLQLLQAARVRYHRHGSVVQK